MDTVLMPQVNGNVALRSVGGLILAVWLGVGVLRDSFAMSGFGVGPGLAPSTGGSAWTLEGNRNQYRLISQQVLQEAPPQAPAGFSGTWQVLALEGTARTQISVIHPLPKSRVIDELKISVAILAERPGARLRVRVVFPYSRNPSTGEPLRFVLLGPEYNRYGKWEVLSLEDIPRLISKQLFVLRAEYGPDVDPKGAYIDQVGVNIYLDNYRTNIILGPPRVVGFVSAEAEPPLRNSPWDPANLPPYGGEGRQNPSFRVVRTPALAAGSFGQLNLGLQRDLNSALNLGVSIPADSLNGLSPPQPQSLSLKDGPPRMVTPSHRNPVEGTGGESGKDSLNFGVGHAGFEVDLAGLDPFQDLSVAPAVGLAGAASGEGFGVSSANLNIREQDAFSSGPASANFGENLSAQPPNESSHTPLVGKISGVQGLPVVPFSSNLPGQQHAPRLAGSSLFAGFRPIFPRLITWQGEPLIILKQTGFNGIWVTGSVSADLLRESKRVGLWVVAPPPVSDSHAAEQVVPFGPYPSSHAASPEGWEQLLAWNLGHQLGRGALPRVRQTAEYIRTLTWRQDAPCVAHVLDGTREMSRLCDILVFERPLWEEGLTLTNWASWLRLRSELARPGTPFWGGIPVHLPPWVREQLQLVGLGEHADYEPSWTAVRSAALVAVGVGARGLVFTTAGRVDGNDPGSQFRRMVLQLLQLELEMLEPFLAGGTLVNSELKSPEGFRAALFRTERARLVVLVPEASALEARDAGTAGWVELTFTIPGVPEAYRAYLLLPGSVRPVRHRRTAGGIQVSIDQYILGAHILLTNEPTVLAAMSERATQVGPTASSLLRHLTAQCLVRRGSATADGKFLPASTPEQKTSVREKAQAWLRQCDDRFRLADYAEAWVAAQQAYRVLLAGPVGPFPSSISGSTSTTIISHPVGCVFPGNERHLNGGASRRGFRENGEELLVGCDFEDLSLLVQLGWRHYLNPSEPAAGQVLLSAQAAYRGQSGLELRAEPASGAASQPLLESPPLWLVSPPLSPPPGGWVVISMWVRIPEEIRGSIDGLIIADSYGGLPMGVRLRKTTGWQRVELHRRVPNNRSLEVLITLSGYGVAFVDEMTVNWVPDEVPRASVLPDVDPFRR